MPQWAPVLLDLDFLAVEIIRSRGGGIVDFVTGRRYNVRPDRHPNVGRVRQGNLGKQNVRRFLAYES